MESHIHSSQPGFTPGDPDFNIDDLVARVRRYRTLESFAVETGSGEGVDLESLEPGTTLTIQTLNSQYRLTVMDGERGKVLVKGGHHFPEPTPAVLQGSSAGGSLLKAGWIGVDLHMELRVGPRRIITSRVRSIKTDQPSSDHTAAHA